MDYDKHKRQMLDHCIRMAEVDKHYAWWAANHYARESAGALADLPDLLAAEMKRRAAERAQITTERNQQEPANDHCP